MTIRSIEKFTAALWDWSCLDGCFGDSRIHPTDIDGIVEVRDHFLLIEAKGPSATVTAGQARMFNALVKLPRFTVLVLYGQPGEPVRAQRWPSKPQRADLDGVRRFVSAWYAKAVTK